MLLELGPPPNDALQRSHWASNLLAKVTWLSLNGKVSREMESSVRAFVGAINRATPIDIAAQLEKLLKADSEATEADTVGPRMEKR